MNPAFYTVLAIALFWGFTRIFTVLAQSSVKAINLRIPAMAWYMIAGVVLQSIWRGLDVALVPQENFVFVFALSLPPLLAGMGLAPRFPRRKKSNRKGLFSLLRSAESISVIKLSCCALAAVLLGFCFTLFFVPEWGFSLCFATAIAALLPHAVGKLHLFGPDAARASDFLTRIIYAAIVVLVIEVSVLECFLPQSYHPEYLEQVFWGLARALGQDSPIRVIESELLNRVMVGLNRLLLSAAIVGSTLWLCLRFPNTVTRVTRFTYKEDTSMLFGLLLVYSLGAAVLGIILGVGSAIGPISLGLGLGLTSQLLIRQRQKIEVAVDQFAGTVFFCMIGFLTEFQSFDLNAFLLFLVVFPLIKMSCMACGAPFASSRDRADLADLSVIATLWLLQPGITVAFIAVLHGAYQGHTGVVAAAAWAQVLSAIASFVDGWFDQANSPRRCNNPA